MDYLQMVEKKALDDAVKAYKEKASGREVRKESAIYNKGKTLLMVNREKANTVKITVKDWRI